MNNIYLSTANVPMLIMLHMRYITINIFFISCYINIIYFCNNIYYIYIVLDYNKLYIYTYIDHIIILIIYYITKTEHLQSLKHSLRTALSPSLSSVYSYFTHIMGLIKTVTCRTKIAACYVL